jgi:two-component system sensor kinase FixL
MERVIPATAGSTANLRVPSYRQAAIVAVLFFAYILLDRLTFHFPGRFGVTPFNPEAAVAIALLYFFGLRYAVVVFLAVTLGELMPLATGRPPNIALVLAAILTTGYMALAMLLKERLRIQTEFATRRDMLLLIAATLVCMLLCGLAYVGTLAFFDLGRGGRYWYGVRRFFIGYSASILVAAPLIFMLFDLAWRRQIAAFSRSGEAWLLVAAIAACVGWVFLQEQRTHVQNFYLLFLPMIWAATRFGLVGAVLALAQIQVGLYFAFHFTGYQPQSVFNLQLMMIALAVTGLLLGVVSDEQRRALRDFRESLKVAAAGEMAAAIAHEINQPLTALSVYATASQLLSASPNLDRARLADTMNKLMIESRRTAAVVQRLRDFFRTGATQLEPIALGALADKVVQRQSERAQRGEVAMTLRAAPDLPRVLGDALQIEVVMRNLIVNAIESAAALRVRPGRVDIDITLAGDEITVSVHDSGAGFAAVDAERLFASFTWRSAVRLWRPTAGVSGRFPATVVKFALRCRLPVPRGMDITIKGGDDAITQRFSTGSVDGIRGGRRSGDTRRAILVAQFARLSHCTIRECRGFPECLPSELDGLRHRRHSHAGHERPATAGGTQDTRILAAGRHNHWSRRYQKCA